MTPAETAAIDRHIRMYVHPDYVPILPWIDETDDLPAFYQAMKDYLIDSNFAWYERIGLTKREAEAILDHAEKNGITVDDKYAFCTEAAYYLELMYDRLAGNYDEK